MPENQNEIQQNEANDVVQEPDPGMLLGDVVATLDQLRMTFLNMTHTNPIAIKALLANDLLPVLSDGFKSLEWYIMDLNERLVQVEGDEEEESAEGEVEDDEEGSIEIGIDPELGGEIIDYIGKTMWVYGHILDMVMKSNNPELIAAMQSVVSLAPSLMQRIKDIIIEDFEVEGEEEPEDEDAEPPEVIEPLRNQPQMPVQVKEYHSISEEAPLEPPVVESVSPPAMEPTTEPPSENS
jgi:hypothetical protein